MPTINYIVFPHTDYTGTWPEKDASAKADALALLVRLNPIFATQGFSRQPQPDYPDNFDIYKNATPDTTPNPARGYAVTVSGGEAALTSQETAKIVTELPPDPVYDPPKPWGDVIGV